MQVRSTQRRILLPVRCSTDQTQTRAEQDYSELSKHPLQTNWLLSLTIWRVPGYVQCSFNLIIVQHLRPMIYQWTTGFRFRFS